jgi:hypothetical protein
MCTPQATGSLIAAEYLGIPAVVVTAPAFAVQARITAYNNGVPVARVAVYPRAFNSDTDDLVTETTTNVLVPKIIDGLTKPLQAAEADAVVKQIAGESKAVVFSGTVNEVNRFFIEKNWTDGLPIIPPTVDRVEEFLQYSPLSRDETVAILPIAYRNTTAWTVAVNGVMAGCPPEYMPILIAFVKGLADPQSRIDLGSTHSWIPYAWINGPVARQLGIDNGQALITEPKNAVLGRAISLMVKNLSGYYIKQDRMGSFGYPVSWFLAENEEFCRQIGWKPYHVQQGFDLNQSTLTVSSSLMWGNNLIPNTADPKMIMNLISWEMVEKQRFSTGGGTAFTYRTLMITPPVARDLSKAFTKESLETELVKNARRTASERAFANFYANPGGLPAPTFEENISKITKAEGGEAVGLPPWFPKFPGAEKIVTVPVMKQGKTAILVCGDESRNKTQTMPGGNYTTKEIQLPANWDALMEKAGYRPLKEFFLK